MAPTRRVGMTKSGSTARARSASRQSSTSRVIAALVSTIVFSSTATSVDDIIEPTPCTSFSTRDSASPGRAAANHTSGRSVK